MTKTKKKKQTEKLYCPYCGRMAVLRPAKHVYGSQNLDPGNYLYVCSGYPSCDSYIGVHKKTMRPMGTLANGDLRHKRIEAHRALNQVVNSGIMTKKGIYLVAEQVRSKGKRCPAGRPLSTAAPTKAHCQPTARRSTTKARYRLGFPRHPTARSHSRQTTPNRAGS